MFLHCFRACSKPISIHTQCPKEAGWEMCWLVGGILHFQTHFKAGPMEMCPPTTSQGQKWCSYTPQSTSSQTGTSGFQQPQRSVSPLWVLALPHIHTLIVGLNDFRFLTLIILQFFISPDYPACFFPPTQARDSMSISDFQGSVNEQKKNHPATPPSSCRLSNREIADWEHSREICKTH